MAANAGREEFDLPKRRSRKSKTFAPSIATDNPAAADIVKTQIERTVALIGTLPKMGRIKYRQVVRILPVRRYPHYLIFNAIEANEVVILNVRHGARRSPWES